MGPITPNMIKVLQEIGTEHTVTGFGYNNNDLGKRYLNANTVQALIKRGLLEYVGTMAWNTERDTVKVYRISEAGKQSMEGKESAQLTVAQQHILDAMEQEQYELWETLYIVAGTPERRTGKLMRPGSGRKPVQVATIDALLTQKRIAECGRYRYSEGTEQGKPYEAWHIDYRLANPVTVQQ